MMRILLSLLAIFSYAACWAQEIYTLHPVGTHPYKTVTNTHHFGGHDSKSSTPFFSFSTSTPIKDIDIEYFQLFNQSTYPNQDYGVVEKPNTWTRSYQLCVNGEVISTHYSSFFSWGSLWDCLKYFNVYDSAENWLGHIEGYYWTKKAAEFVFYDQDGEPFAEALLEPDYKTINIVDPVTKAPLIICKKTRYTELSPLMTEIPFYWTIQPLEGVEIDSHFIWPFIAFICEVWWK